MTWAALLAPPPPSPPLSPGAPLPRALPPSPPSPPPWPRASPRRLSSAAPPADAAPASAEPGATTLGEPRPGGVGTVGPLPPEPLGAGLSPPVRPRPTPRPRVSRRDSPAARPPPRHTSGRPRPFGFRRTGRPGLAIDPTLDAWFHLRGPPFRTAWKDPLSRPGRPSRFQNPTSYFGVPGRCGGPPCVTDQLTQS